MQYHFRAIDAEGHARRGRMIATNPAELERRLTGMGLTLIAHKAESWQRRSALPSFSVSRRDMIHFCLSLEQLMRAGVPLQEGLTDLRDSTDNPRMAEVIAAIIDDIEGGRTLSQAMAAHPRVFNRMVTGLVEAGEAAGMLSDVFARLTTSLKRQDELIAQAKRLVIYPAFLLTLMIGVIGFLMVYLIPQLSDFLRSLQKDLPWQTQLLISVSHFVVDYGLLVLLGCVGGGMFILAAMRSSPLFARGVDRIKLSLPIFGPIYRKIVLARFATHFGMLYGAGITVLDALTLSANAVGNREVASCLIEVRARIAEGGSITDSFAEGGLFPPLVVRMMRVGETTGGLDEALANVSYFYQRDVDEAVDQMQALLEPSLTVALSLMLAWIISAVLTPVYDMLSRLG